MIQLDGRHTTIKQWVFLIAISAPLCWIILRFMVAEPRPSLLIPSLQYAWKDNFVITFLSTWIGVCFLRQFFVIMGRFIDITHRFRGLPVEFICNVVFNIIYYSIYRFALFYFPPDYYQFSMVLVWNCAWEIFYCHIQITHWYYNYTWEFQQHFHYLLRDESFKDEFDYRCKLDTGIRVISSFFISAFVIWDYY
eukprot:UN27899